MVDQGSKKMGQTIEGMVNEMQCCDHVKVLHATRAVRKISQEKIPPIEMLIQQGVAPICVRFLGSKNDELPFEAAWILTNIACGTSEQTMAVVNANAVPALVKSMRSTVVHVAEQATWALSNIAGDSSIARNIVLEHGAAEEIQKLLENEQPASFLRNIVWLMSNLCRNKNPRPPIEKIKIMLPALAKLLRHDDVKVLSDTTWAISYAIDSDDDGGERIEAVIKAGCVPDLIQLLGHEENDVVFSALRGIRNIVSGSDAQVDVALKAGVLEHMKKLLNDSDSKMVENAAFTISNITAGNTQQIQAVIDAGIFENIRNLLVHDDICVVREAALAIANTSSSGTPKQILYLCERVGILKPFCDLIRLNDEQLDLVVKDGLNDFLNIAGTDILTLRVAEKRVSDLSSTIENIKLK